MPETLQQRDSQENRQLNRVEESPDQRVHCLERDRNRTRRRREDETPDQHQCHLERERDRARCRREDETTDQRRHRLERTRAVRSEQQLLMSSEAACIARSAAASRQQQSRANETPQHQQTHRCHQRWHVLQDLLLPVDNSKVRPMKPHNNNKLAEQLMPLDSRKVGSMNIHKGQCPSVCLSQRCLSVQLSPSTETGLRQA